MREEDGKMRGSGRCGGGKEWEMDEGRGRNEKRQEYTNSGKNKYSCGVESNTHISTPKFSPNFVGVLIRTFTSTVNGSIGNFIYLLIYLCC